MARLTRGVTDIPQKLLTFNWNPTSLPVFRCAFDLPESFRSPTNVARDYVIEQKFNWRETEHGFVIEILFSLVKSLEEIIYIIPAHY